MRRNAILLICAFWGVTGATAAEDAATTLRNLCDLAAASDRDYTRPRSVPGVSSAKVDPKVAIPACEAAAAATPDDARIRFQLGRAYYAAQSYENARYAFIRAANGGNVLAANNLGVMHNMGEGVAKDPVEARKWFEKAAATGFPLAMSNLGQLDPDGSGVAPDYARAAELFEKAAKAGDANGAYELARLTRPGAALPATLVKRGAGTRSPRRGVTLRDGRGRQHASRREGRRAGPAAGPQVVRERGRSGKRGCDEFADPQTEIVVDVERLVVEVPAVGLVELFPMDPTTQQRFLDGLDDIGITLGHADDITDYETNRPVWLTT